jgi:thiosulfate/3-mercaptopyruvate sulfurtransferase
MPVSRALLLGLAFASTAVAGQKGEFAYASDARAALASGAVVIDARAREACVERSLAAARCLPAAEFLGPHRRLASWRDILWLLGTAGLQGEESVLIVGDAPVERDFVAGLLHIAGSRSVTILTEPVQRLLAKGVESGAGAERGFTRSAVFEAPMRDALVVLGHELRALKPRPSLVDGRSEEEYWGENVRAARGGHLPGAQSLPAARLRAALGDRHEVLPAGSPIVYAHDALEGLAYFTLLRAGHGVDARIYPAGWAEWAADGSLPADAVSYPDRAPSTLPRAAAAAPSWWWPWIAGVLGLAAAAFAGGWLVARARHA